MGINQGSKQRRGLLGLTAAVALAVFLLAQNAAGASANSPAGVTSDEFDGTSLSGAWTFVNPVGDGSVNVSGGAVSITAPGANNHDIWSSGVDAPRIMQSVTDDDFEVEAKFDSVMTQRFQLQGILAQAGPTTYLRFGTYYDGSSVRYFVAVVDDGAVTVNVIGSGNIPASPYLQVERAGNTWTFRGSSDGASWQTIISFNRTFALSALGVYAGNVAGPSHTAIVDYFRDVLAPPPSQPTAVDDSYAVDEDTTLNVPAPGVLGNDSDPEGDPLTAVPVTNPANGSLTLNSDGSFTYTPNADFDGSDSFTYRASDGGTQSLAATVTIDINPLQDPPVALDQSVNASLDTPLAITLTGFDPDSDPLTFAVATQPTHGTLSGTEPNMIYTPDTSYLGPDSFTFTASDAFDTSAPATIQITVTEATGLFSDEFSGSTLAPGWTFVDPLGDSSYSVSGGAVSISTLAGTNHDIWTSGIYAPRIMQEVADEDFEIEAKFDSSLTQKYQLQGFLAQAGPNQYIRFGNYSNGSSVKAFVAFFDMSAQTVTVYANPTLTPSATSYLRLGRQGNAWTFERSTNGTNWQTIVVFNRTFALSDLGVYGGNVSGPAHTAIIDYFHNTTPVPGNPPVALPDSYTTDEDTALNVSAPGVLGNDTDPEGDPLTAQLVSAPSNGAVTLNSNGSFTYTPFSDFNGSDSFTYRAKDAASQSSPATVSITVDPVNDAPDADPQLVATPPDTPIAITLTGSDAENDPLTFAIDTLPSNGVLSGTPPNVTYTPNPGFEGIDSFTFTASDATETSAPGTVTINVQQPGDGQIVFFYGANQHFGDVGTPQVWVDVLGNASDSDGIASLTYSLNGGPQLPLTMGPDSRRLVNEGDFNVQLAIGDLVDGVNQVIVTATDNNSNVTQEAMTLNYSAGTVWPLTYSIDWDTVTDVQDAVQVVDGEWVVGPNGITNGSNTGYDRLFAIGNTDWTDFTATIPITVHGYDPSGNWCCGVGVILRWQGHTDDPVVCSQPKCGWNPYGNEMWYEWDATGGHSSQFAGNSRSLTDTTGPVLQIDVTYMFKLEVETIGGQNYYRKKVWVQGQPEPAGWLVEEIRNIGLDSGSLLVLAHHTEITVGDIVITPVGGVSNDPPTAVGDGYSVDEDTVLNEAAPGVLVNDTDPETDPLSAVLESDVSNGTLVLNADGSFTYTPDANFNGSDSFTYRASDGSNQSSPATVSLTVNAINDAPVAQDQSVDVEENSAVGVTLVATDVENDPLNYLVTTQPTHGALSGTAPDLTYTPDPGYFGPDSFTFTASDAESPSNEATVSITVFEINDAPTAFDDGYTTDEDTVLNEPAPGVLSNDTDPETDPMTAELVSDVSNGTLTLNLDGSFTYTPAANFNGSDSFTYVAKDANKSSTPATVTITVNAVNDVPVADSQSVTTAVDTPVGITLTGSDVENEPLTFAVDTPPAHGDLTGTPPNLTYTPDPGYSGPDSFTFTASDASDTSDPATVTIDIGAATVLSDEFDGTSLSGAWTFVNPVGDGSVNVGGGTVSITAPGANNHDIWSSGVDAPRIMQAATDDDFEIEVKFDSVMTQRFQLQGIIAQAGPTTYLRFGTYFDGTNVRYFVAAVDDGAGTVDVIGSGNIAASPYLQVQRSGDTWTFRRSSDGVNWQTIISFNRTFALSALGVYAGNVGGPSHTAIIDYFREIS